MNNFIVFIYTKIINKFQNKHKAVSEVHIMLTDLNYKDYHATFENNILNIYDNSNKLLTSRSYSDITYNNEVDNIFKNIIDVNIK